jgi:peptide/nickel transport system ATP-binding protein
MLIAQQLSKEYTVKQKGKNASLQAVKPVSLTISSGKRYALVGESGSGKTTLARLLSGIITPTGGKVLLDGQNVCGVKNRRAVYRKLQIIFQDTGSSLNPQMTVYNLIAEPLRNLLHLSHAEEKMQVYELMTRMGLPLEYCKRKPRELSGGQQKRICIARAIGVKPEIVIFDEAFSGLDVIVRKNILELLDDLHEELGCTYLMITHDIDVALYSADTIFVMKDGEIIERAQYQGDTACFTHEYSRLPLKK